MILKSTFYHSFINYAAQNCPRFQGKIRRTYVTIFETVDFRFEDQCEYKDLVKIVDRIIKFL